MKLSRVSKAAAVTAVCLGLAAQSALAGGEPKSQAPFTRAFSGGSAIVAATVSESAAAGTLAVAKLATAKFHTLAVAEKNGYGLLKDVHGVSCIAMTDMPQMGAMGIHYANGGLVKSGTIKAAAPQALVYAPEPGGKLSLAALEYVVLKSTWDAAHATPPTLFGRTFNFTPGGNRYGLPAFYSLHAWVWKPNPSGTFSMWNPTVTCPS